MSDYQRMRERIQQVQQATYSELRTFFAELYGEAVCPTNNTTLRNRIIYKIQEQYYGGISSDDMRFLLEVSENRKNKKTSASTHTESVVHYVRKWKNKKYDVTAVSANCFILEGKQYKSLSAVARAITGTRWNGKIFFGVKK